MKFLIFFFSLTTFSCLSRNAISVKMETYLFAGKYNEGIKWIQKEKKKGAHLAQLSQYEGDFYKLKGDLDEALVHWKESNRIRTRIYKPNDSHMAWNYALLSNYYFEKIETKLAKKYADSCYRLIKGLTPKQQSEIEIYKIWNILAQSNKQYVENNFLGIDALHKYKWIRGFYAKSISFINENQLPAFYLAKTYHLIGNTYQDNIHTNFKMNSSHDRIYNVFKKAEENYNRALKLWTESFGKIHHERAKTLYLLGMMYMLFAEEQMVNRYVKPSYFFDQAIEAYGIEPSVLDSTRLKNIPNKEDALQCLRFKNETLFKQMEELKMIQLIHSAELIAKQSVKLWEITYREFKSTNTNQLLGIYNLIPFKDVIQIETLKRKNNLSFSLNRIFQANEKLKYFDLKKQAWSSNVSTISIDRMQRKLKKGEVFLDFMSNQINHYFVMAIQKDNVRFYQLDDSTINLINGLHQSIVDLNYTNYLKLSMNVYHGIFHSIDISRIKRLIICPDGEFNKVVFEALVCSDKNSRLNDYRRLDYLVNHAQIEYTLSPGNFLKVQAQIPLRIAAFAPFNSAKNYAELPFSAILLDKMSEFDYVKVFKREAANTTNFLNAKSPIIHFSGHGKIDAQSSSATSLVFSDRLLNLSDIPLMQSPQLVVLNACNSSNGKFIAGDGIDGFVRAFHAAGTDVTIANLWEVDDQFSNDLFARFYANLTVKSQISTVMQQTKIDYITTASQSELAAPYYWAGHRVMGDGMIIQNEKTPASTMIYWIAGVLVLVVYLIFRFPLKFR